MITPRDKFQRLLKKLFQFESAELDFGIYRIMNQKRAIIEQFIDKNLVDVVAVELSSGALGHEAGLARQLREVSAQIFENFGNDALDADGKLAAQYQKTPRGMQYLELREQAGRAKSSPELEAEIFNHLFAFFSRYYDNGDFMSLRRYSKRDKYIIPYNGEEVHLHWANSDQYYVKTAEHFSDYSYAHGGWTVQFKLRNAEVEQGNIKGEKRLFLPRTSDITLDRKACTLTIPFEYRPLNAGETVRYGSKNKNINGNDSNGQFEEDITEGNKKRGQEGILAEAMLAIMEVAKKTPGAMAALLHEKRKDADGNSVGLLEHHLLTYTRTNSSDFFVHKDLTSFLSRELDFYIKNEVLNLDELEVGGETHADSWFQRLRVIQSIGRKIIAFLAQIENLQKRLFEKKKFVTKSHYCVTLDRVPPELYPEITKNKAQIDEWQRLFLVNAIKRDTTQPGFSNPPTVAFLNAHRSLVIDTAFFSAKFEDVLLSSKEFLASTDSLDDALSGYVLHSENYAALKLLQNRFAGSLSCVYIDPPYNRGDDEFIYKDSYQSSSWLAMMQQSTSNAIRLLAKGGAFFVSCDENEFLNLGILLRREFGEANQVETIVWNKRIPKNDKGIGNIHEYIHLFVQDAASRIASGQPFVMKKDGIEDIYELVEKLKRNKVPLPDAEKKLKDFYRKEGFDRGITLYCQLDKKYEIWGKINLSWPNPQTQGPRYKVINPVTKRPVPIPKNGWRWKEETFRKAEANGPTFKLHDGSMMRGRIWFAADEETQPSSIIYLKEVESFLLRSFISLKSDGSLVLENLGLARGIDYPKPVTLIERLFYSVGSKDGLFLDHFAGSGTSGHAIISLNREDGGKRKYILVEMGKYFDTVLLPRLQKVIYSKDWKDGKPISREGSSHAFKYLRLESYEDALDNIAFQSMDAQAALQFEEYVLSYMLDFETKESETFLNVSKLDAPFDYKLHQYGKDELLPVNLPETFNYLIGLHLISRHALENNRARYLVYRGLAAGRNTVIIWRTTTGWTKREFEADRDFVRKENLVEGAEDIFVNSDSFIPGARSLDPVFKRQMFSEE